MVDYLVSVGLETRTGTAKRDVEGVAAAVEKVDTASKKSSTSLSTLETATDKVSLAHKRLQIEQGRVEASERALLQLRQRGQVQTQNYRSETEKLVTAQERVARATESVQRAEAKAAGRTPGDLAKKAGAAFVGYQVGRRVGAFAGDSVEQASALTQAARTGTVVFGAYERQVEDFGKRAAESIGLSRVQAVGASSDLGVLFSNLKIGQGISAKMSTSLVDLGAKLGLLKNTGATPALDALKGAFVGEFDALQRYGININAAAVKQEALRLGLIRTVKDGLTPASQAQATYSLILQQGAVAQGVFKDRGDDLAVQQMKTSAAMANAKEALGEGLVPVMTGAAKVMNDDLIPAFDKFGSLIGFLGKNDAARHGLEILVGLGGALYIVVKSVKAFNEVQSVLLGRAPKTVLANEAIARSYDAVALAAGRAALAEKAAAGGGGVPPVVPGAPPVLTSAERAGSRFGKVLGIGLRSTVAGAITYATFKYGDPHLPRFLQSGEGGYGGDTSRFKQEGELARGPDGKYMRGPDGKYLLKSEVESGAAAPTAAPAPPPVNPYASNARAIAQAKDAYRQAVLFTQGGYKATAGSIPLGGLLDALPEKPDPSVVDDARAALSSSKAAVAIAEARVRQARSGRGGSSAGQIASAQAAVLTARDAVEKRGGNAEAEALRLKAAEENLAKAKAGGKTNTVQLMTAEKSLADARKKQERDVAALHKAEKEASGDKSISLKDVLARADAAAGTATGEVTDVRKLVHAHVSKPVIDELEQLERTAPGTIKNVAKGLTPAFVKQLNADQAARDKAQMDLASLGSQAAAADKLQAARQAGVDLAKAMQQGYIDQLNGSGHAPLLGFNATPPPPPPPPPPPKPAPPKHDEIDRSHPITTKSTTVNMPNTTIVSNNSDALFKEIDKRARRDALR